STSKRFFCRRKSVRNRECPNRAVLRYTPARTIAFHSCHFRRRQNKFHRETFWGSKMNSPPSDVTQLLGAMKQGDQVAFEQLLPLVYDELHRIAARQMARQHHNHTLQTTGLIHEAYLRLANQEEKRWENRAHFFAVAATVMRHILVDHARARQ